MSDATVKHDASSQTAEKAAYVPMSGDRRLEVVAELTDDVLAALTRAFFEVIKREKWGKRDLARISGINETTVGHILAGRRKNLTIESIAILARAMQKRPELVLHDVRGTGNHSSSIQMSGRPSSAADALQEKQLQQTSGRVQGPTLGRTLNYAIHSSICELEVAE